MTFKDLALKASSNSATEFLDILKAQKITHFNEYLLFDVTNMAKNFSQNLEFLKDDGIWTEKELENYQLIAQTIDNDFILSNDQNILVIPSSFHHDDSEIFEVTIWQFFESFEDQTLDSHILAVN